MQPLSLFEGYGIEIEHMVVDAESLAVRPIVDELLRAAHGTDEWVEDHDDGAIGWSNELVAHVVELKTNGPAPSFEGLAQDFRASAGRMNAWLAEHAGARLMPTAMHPWMDPRVETQLWRHEHAPVYEAYDRLFDCRRHGWANVQSVHLNLPFANDDEFARLMAASRLVLPLIPALAASSPIVERRATGLADSRLEFYRTNSAKVPSMTGGVIPEPIYDPQQYRDVVLGGLQQDLVAIGADPILRGEWTNARGAIARFDRMAIELRLIDSQECHAADLAVAAAVAGVVRALVEERWSSRDAQAAADRERLAELLGRVVRDGPEAVLDDREFLAHFGRGAAGPLRARDLWRHLADEAFAGSADLEASVETILRDGALGERLLAALAAGDAPGPEYERDALHAVWSRLCDCLAEGRAFTP